MVGEFTLIVSWIIEINGGPNIRVFARTFCKARFVLPSKPGANPISPALYLSLHQDWRLAGVLLNLSWIVIRLRNSDVAPDAYTIRRF